MKRLLLSAIALLFTSALFAQSFKIQDISGNDITGTTIHVWGDSSSLIEADVHVLNTNNSSNFKMAMCKRRLNYNNIPGSINYFCWTACYSPAADVSPSPDTLYFNQVYTKFHGYMNPYNASGDVSITYTVYDNTNNADSSWVTIIYHAGAAGINNAAVTGENKISTAYPNPAASFTSLNYSLKSNVRSGKISVYNMIGDVVKEIKLEDKQGTVKLHVDELTPGIYFYSLVADNKIITTKRLVVSH